MPLHHARIRIPASADRRRQRTQRTSLAARHLAPPGSRDEPPAPTRSLVETCSGPAPTMAGLCVPPCPLWLTQRSLPLAQEQFPHPWRQPEGKLKDLAIQRNPQNEFLLRLPPVDPLAGSAKEDPPASFLIARVEMR